MRYIRNANRMFSYSVGNDIWVKAIDILLTLVRSGRLTYTYEDLIINTLYNIRAEDNGEMRFPS